MRYELVQLYVKDNYLWLYNHIETRYNGKIKAIAYKTVAIGHEKEIKKYIKKLLKNT